MNVEKYDVVIAAPVWTDHLNENKMFIKNKSMSFRTTMLNLQNVTIIGHIHLYRAT